MKYVLAMCLAVSAGTVLACPSGSKSSNDPKHPGACEAPMSSLDPQVVPSNEKPSRNKVPAWMREGIKIDDAKPAERVKTAGWSDQDETERK